MDASEERRKMLLFFSGSYLTTNTANALPANAVLGDNLTPKYSLFNPIPSMSSLMRNLNTKNIDGALRQKIAEANSCVGTVSSNDDPKNFLGTVFRVGRNLVLTARHVFNQLRKNEIIINFDDGSTSSIKSVIIDGSTLESPIDYILCEITTNYEKYLHLTATQVASYACLFAVDPKEKACITGNAYLSSSYSQLMIDSFEKLPHGGSGGPWISLDKDNNNGDVFALTIKNSQSVGLNAQTTQSCPIDQLRAHPVIKALLTKNPLTIDVAVQASRMILPDDYYFRYFSTEIPELHEQDIGNAREICVGPTPSIRSDIGKEILRRWVLNGKAKYDASNTKEKNLERQLNDHGNWKIQLYTYVGNGVFEKKWVRLGDTYPPGTIYNSQDYSGLPIVSMGHKLDAKDYWNKGSNSYLTKRIAYKELNFARSPVILKSKKAELAARYTDYTIPGKKHRLFYDEQAPGYSSEKYKNPMAKFMQDSRNYKFEDTIHNQAAGTNAGIIGATAA